MTMFHINNKGIPAICTATKRSCPLGEHFATEKEAQKSIDIEMEGKHPLLPTNLRDSFEAVDLVKRHYKKIEDDKPYELTKDNSTLDNHRTLKIYEYMKEKGYNVGFSSIVEVLEENKEYLDKHNIKKRAKGEARNREQILEIHDSLKAKGSKLGFITVVDIIKTSNKPHLFLK